MVGIEVVKILKKTNGAGMDWKLEWGLDLDGYRTSPLFQSGHGTALAQGKRILHLLPFIPSIFLNKAPSWHFTFSLNFQQTQNVARNLQLELSPLFTLLTAKCG